MAEKKGLFTKAGKLSAPEMRPTPRSRLAGLIADAMIGVRDFADRARVPESVPLLGGQGVGSLFLGRAPEEVNELSYGNSPFQINPYAGRTGSYVPEMKRGRGAQVFDALSLLSVPGAKTVAGGLFGGGLTPGVDAAATVFHGSPHKFDRFDSSKIGTGEGAQAYGHGLYFAESPQVAQGYQRDISRAQMASGKTEAGDMIAGKPIEVFYEQLQRKADRLPPALAGVEYEKLAFLEDLMQQPSFSDAVKRIDNEAIVPWAKALESKYQPAGSLYKVDLPDEAIAKMLDWDKPLSQQAPEVRKAFESRVAPLRQQYATPVSGWGDLGGAQTYDPTGRELLELLRQRDVATAQDFLGSGLGRDVSEQLRQQGIPGIRYLDAGSRGQGQGSSNYVVFPGNENLLTILERNGQVMNPIYRDPMGDTLADTIR
jgi:hypothetical protein